MEVGTPVFKGIYYIRMRWRLTFLSLSSTNYERRVFERWLCSICDLEARDRHYDPHGTTRPVGTATGCSSCKVKIARSCG